MPHPLPLTGERTVPGVEEEAYWFARHEAAYAWVAGTLVDRLPGPVVVDAGVGEGYGADRLRSGGARAVVAVDYDAATLGHLRDAYPRLAPVRANLAALPLGTAAADVVVALQVVEHLWDLPDFLVDCRRVLRPGGVLAVTTPNRPVQSPGLGRGERPTNPFHVEEFDADQVRDLLHAAGFGRVSVLGLRHGPRLREWEAGHGSMPQALVAAVLQGRWPTGLRAAVRAVTADDFEVRPEVAEAFDLVGVGWRP